MAPRGPFANLAGSKPEVTFKPAPRGGPGSSTAPSVCSSAMSVRSEASSRTRAATATSAVGATPRSNDVVATPRSNDVIATPRSNDVVATPRSNDAASTVISRAASMPPPIREGDGRPALPGGYHGARVDRSVRNRRLYGNAPLLRSCIDEIVYGRNIDLSGEGDAEHPGMVHLIDSYTGAAGHKAAMAQCMHGTNPDDPPNYCIKPLCTMKNQNLGTHAGLSKYEATAPSKRIWPRERMQASGFGSVVFQMDIPKAGDTPKVGSGEDQLMQAYKNNAGRASGLWGWKEGGEGRPNRKRIYATAPASVTNMDATMHPQVTGRSPRCERSETEAHHGKKHLLKQFTGAAGVSPRLVRDSTGEVSHLQEANTGFTSAVYWGQSGHFVRSTKI